MEGELAALAAAAATALVNAMVTESWEQAKTRLARLFGRRGRSGEPAEDEAREALEEERSQLASARNTDDEGTAADVENALLQRLGRLLREDPEAAPELRELLTELRAAGVPVHSEISGGIQYGAFQNSTIHGGVTYHFPRPPGPDTVIPDEVPALRVPFVNRQLELTRMDGVLAAADGDSGHVDVLVLGGTPGVGKTATASRYAHSVRDRYPDGQLYVDFAELRGQRGGGDVSAAMESCLRSLGVQETYLPPSLADQTRLFRSKSAGRRILLVLDDVDEPAQVRALVPQGPGSAVLVTSNGRLGELTLDGATLLPLDPLDAGSALRILADRCGAAAVEAEPEAAERLVELCGGLPVALHVVASRLVHSRRLTMSRLARELSDEARRLTAMSLGGKASVSAVFDSAYGQLTADEARFYRLLGWLPCRTFDVAAAAAATATDPEVAAPLLDVLEDVALLTPVDDDRYRLHDLVRLHARERAAAEETSQTQRAVVERLVTHYLTVTACADRTVREDRLRTTELDQLPRDVANPFALDDAPSPLSWLDTERAGILALLREGHGFGLHTPVWLLAEAFTVLFLHRRHVQDWKESLEVGVAAAAEAGELEGEARLRSLLSRPLLDLDELEEAHAQLERAVVCAEAAGRTDLRASVLEFYGRYWDRVDPARAVEVYRHSLELNTEAGEERGAAIALLFLGSAHDAAGDPGRALTTLRSAHAALASGGESGWKPDPRMAARALLAIGRAHEHLGDTDEAVAAFTEAAAELRTAHATHYEAEALLELAAIAERRDEPVSLREYLTRALEIHERGGSPRAVELRERLMRVEGETDT
ncbi:tetratricopeptide repeat protein [Streptomyces sp. Amel2xB2]|uniref:NB-ARC domain-containing protein n=1 Tax=Streptomyces sp. Amel2xB2 TaxID=1305829 RepID=UPI000DBFE663|nr:NB-ARC domain-containing protein [Streptomyces sp. Amel2xB2]RAJ67135.1 tetratricopeptide repeat protein [Streptomyces sp. Amel2xB2]